MEKTVDNFFFFKLKNRGDKHIVDCVTLSKSEAYINAAHSIFSAAHFGKANCCVEAIVFVKIFFYDEYINVRKTFGR